MIEKVKEKIKDLSKDNKKLLLFCVIGVFVLITIIGGSYALLSLTLSGRKELEIVAGTLAVRYEDGNVIQLENLYPVSDKEGMQNTASGFSVENTGELRVKYDVSLELGKSKDELDAKYIRYAVREKGKEWSSPASLKDGSNNQNIATTITPGVTIQNMAADKVFNPTNLGSNGGINTSDSEQTFITGTNPNNYIWYSGNLWRVVSKDTSDNSLKMITQWNATNLRFSKNSWSSHGSECSNPEGQGDFDSSYVIKWLNDTSTDGFLGNLREYTKFIKTDSKWNMTHEPTSEYGKKPAKTHMVTAAVGILNIYEYSKTNATSTENSYLINGSTSVALPRVGEGDNHFLNSITSDGHSTTSDGNITGVRPVINLKSNIKIVSGSGTETNPYRLEGDNDTPASGTRLNTRYSGEYVKFKSSSDTYNNLYRIVSKEHNGSSTKIVADKPLNNKYGTETKVFSLQNNSSTDCLYNIEQTGSLAQWLNNTNYMQNLPQNLINFEEWYLGTVTGCDDYRTAKYQGSDYNTLVTDKTKAYIGLLRFGELMASDYYDNQKQEYWLLNQKYLNPEVWSGCKVYVMGRKYEFPDFPTNTAGIRPAMYLKENTTLTGGNGTKSNPFIISS